MTTKFVNGMKAETNMTTTENGAVALKSTGSNLLNLFGTIGALRSRTENDIQHEFLKAFAEDKLTAMRMLFYARDIRKDENGVGGLGERRVPRVIMRMMADVHTDTMAMNLELIPEFGRWDDLFVFASTKLETQAFEIMKKQLTEDIRAEKPSLLAKWLPSENTSSKDTVEMARKFRKFMGLSSKVYRKTLSALRARIDVTEVKMSAKKWGAIRYEAVPSKAMSNYRNAFKRNDENRWEGYIGKLVKGETTVNASTLYPYDILEKMCNGRFELGRYGYRNIDQLLEAQWKALPNFVEGENNVVVMADTSGSMQGRPMATSVGLAMYFAERNKGAFANQFMTFSSRPSWVTLTGQSVFEKLKCVPEIVDNTNLEAGLQLILQVGIDNNLTSEEMPKALVIISDMEFDGSTGSRGVSAKNTLYDTMRQRFNAKGYEMPNVIFWNVQARNSHYQVHSDYMGVQLASGQSPSVFKSLLTNIGKDPITAMMDVLGADRYSKVKA